MNFFRDTRATELPDSFDYGYFKETRASVMYDIEISLGDCKMAWLVGNGRDYAIIHRLGVSSRLTPDSIHRRPFREVRQALEWLGLPEDYKFRFTDDD